MRAVTLRSARVQPPKTTRNGSRPASTDDIGRTFDGYRELGTYGAAFAQEVGEAHEVGSDNSPEESARDHANNALGRDYVAAGKTEGQVVHLIRRDPRLVRTTRPSLLTPTRRESAGQP